ncbi:hypothetical protein N665_0149s0001 [Sinapis alba]|nr:hypothetical protein N665_0149s0001 [Sinapis alba]
MTSPIRRCSLNGKAIATASDSDNGSSPRLLGPRAITLGGMIPRPTSEDLAVLNESERDIVQFSLDLEDRDASAAAEKEINLHLSDLLPIRWTGTDFEFDEEIDPEQERRLSVKKNQRWENHFPTRSTFKSVRRLILQTNPPAGFSFLIPADHHRPWTPPAGYACVYESWFTSCSLWLPLPEFLTTYCHRRRIALGQYTANGIRILGTLTVLAAELGILMSVRLFEELTTPNRLSKWSQGGTESFLEEVEAIRTLSHQHWPDISEARIQAALKRLSRSTNSLPSRNSRMGKINLASLPSYADNIGTLVHGDDLSGSGRLAKRRRSATVNEDISRSSPNRSPLAEGPQRDVEDASRHEDLGNEEVLVLSPTIPVIVTEMPTDEHPVAPQTVETRREEHAEPASAPIEEAIGYPHVVDFQYRHLSVPFVEDNEAPARLFRQIQLKRRGMPELDQISQGNRYREMTRAGALFFGSANLMVRDYEAKLKAQDEKIKSKTEALKKKRREIAELAYKCGSFEEQVGVLNVDKIEAAARAEALSKELEELKALNGGLETRCQNLEQENTEILARFETTTRRLRESRELEVKRERLRVESLLKNQVALVYEKVRQFVEEQPLIQSKLALYSQAKGIRESLEKIDSQGLSMEEISNKPGLTRRNTRGSFKGWGLWKPQRSILASRELTSMARIWRYSLHRTLKISAPTKMLCERIGTISSDKPTSLPCKA